MGGRGLCTGDMTNVSLRNPAKGGRIKSKRNDLGHTIVNESGKEST